MNKDFLFREMKPGKALAVMALPTIASQLIVLIYNIADTWFIGRTNNPYMLGASSLGLTIFLASVSLANVFGVGGGSLMARLSGQNDKDNAKKVASYSLAMSAITALIFSIAVLIFMSPLLSLLGASENTFDYARQYILTTTVIGGIPTVLSISMPMLLRNVGYATEAGIGVALGSVLNIVLDPIFMFLILPKGYEVLGAGIATLISNLVSMVFFIIVFFRLRNKTILSIPKRIEKIGSANKKSLFSVGIPAALSVFLFDLVTIIFNRLAASYGDITLAAMGIVLKLERIPMNIAIGICLGMVPLIAYNLGNKNFKRMKEISSIARRTLLIMAIVCMIMFLIFAKQLVGIFIDDEETVMQGIDFLKGRCISLPFMVIGYHVLNYMNAVNKGKFSFILSFTRHVILIVPIAIIMNRLWNVNGLTWSQLVADCIHTVVAILIYRYVNKKMMKDLKGYSQEVSDESINY